MSISEILRDIENYPLKTKTVTLDLQRIVPIDNEGDEIYVITSTPATGTVKIGGGTINPIFVRDFKAGYIKSSGKKNPPFTVTSGSKSLRLSIDGSAFVNIDLTEGSGLTGDSIADDMQTQINALASSGTVSGNIAFLNATVEFKNNCFEIIAGSISNTYVGVGKSSVAVISGATNDITASLGFNIPISSELLSSKQATETILTSPYTASGIALTVESVSDLTAAQAFTISDGINREYFVASGVAANTINLHYGLVNSYDSGSVVQKIFERDPRADLASPYDNLDIITRFALRSVANQIDFSV